MVCDWYRLWTPHHREIGVTSGLRTQPHKLPFQNTPLILDWCKCMWYVQHYALDTLVIHLDKDAPDCIATRISVKLVRCCRVGHSHYMWRDQLPLQFTEGNLICIRPFVHRTCFCGKFICVSSTLALSVIHVHSKKGVDCLHCFGCA